MDTTDTILAACTTAGMVLACIACVSLSHPSCKKRESRMKPVRSDPDFTNILVEAVPERTSSNASDPANP
jgi:hypothetical protein